MEDEDSEKGQTVACRPHLRGGKVAEAKLESLVQRLHQVTFLATEAIALLVREDVEAGVPSDQMLRLGDHGLVNSMFNGVVDGRGPDQKKNPENYAVYQRVREAYHRIHGVNAPLVPSDGLCQAVKEEAKTYKSLVKTSLKVHFRLVFTNDL